MGVVFEATHERLGKAVAVKFLLQHFAEIEATAHERFEQEARAAVAIGHKAIIDVNDYGTTDDGQPYIVMELLRGESLAKLLKERGRLEVRLAAHIMCQVLSALVYAHRMGVIHRDLKPDNVFLVESDRALPEVKLLDFGISKVSSLEGMDTAKTKSGVVLGTPDYMSPEQARGEKDLDHRIDIYAVGALLYECLCGRAPLEADNYNALLLKIALEEPQPIAEIVEDLPAGLASVVGKAIAREREDRYGSALEMLHALAPYADQSLLPSEVRLSPADAEAHEGLAFKPTAAATPHAKRASEAPPTPAPRSSGRRTVLLVALAIAAATAAVVVVLQGRGQGEAHGRDAVPADGGGSARPAAGSGGAGGRPEAAADGGAGRAGGRADAAAPAADGGAGGTAAVSADGGAVVAPAEDGGGAGSDGAVRPAADGDGGRPRRPAGPGRPPGGGGTLPRAADAGPPAAAADGGGRRGRDAALEQVGGDVVIQPEFR